MIPTFILAGTLPAGTGQLYGLLAQHPEVYLAPPMQPECNFFAKSGLYRKGMSYYEETWFRGAGKQKAVGERSSLLLSSEQAPARLEKDVPGVRLIFLFRNPVDRAYANYRFTALAGFEELSFEEALEAEDARAAEAAKDAFWGEILPHAYFRRGLYADQLSRWLPRFPASRLLLMRSDELLNDLDQAAKKIHRFLGVDDGFRPAPFSDFSSPVVLDLKLQRRLRTESPAELDAAIQRFRQGHPPSQPIDPILRANLRSGPAPLAPELRRSLTRRYADSNHRLKDLVPFSIEDWL